MAVTLYTPQDPRLTPMLVTEEDVSWPSVCLQFLNVQHGVAEKPRDLGYLSGAIEYLSRSHDRQARDVAQVAQLAFKDRLFASAASEVARYWAGATSC